TVMYLLSVIPVFRARHPHIKVEVKRSLASRIPSEILGRDTEIGIVSFKPSDAAIAAVPVVMDELTLIVPTDHPLAAKQMVTVREMRLERRLQLIYRKGATLSHAARAFLRVARDLQKEVSSPESRRKQRD